MADFSPDFYVTHTVDPQRGLVDVVAQGTVRQQAYIGGSSPEDIAFTVQAIGSLDAADLPDADRATVIDRISTITDWEVL